MIFSRCKWFGRCLFAIALVLTTCSSVRADNETYLGNSACAGCHAQATADWTESHHDLAMQEATPKTVLGDFNNATFDYFGVTTTFSQKGDAFFIETDNAAGELETYRVEYVFGVEPLQQYLLPLGNGRLQALSVAWDTRPKSEGGQRWYHLYPDEHIAAGDPLHWTGGFFNWNTSCAECHSTDVEKRYDAVNDRFDTHYEQIDVGCEACHGPGSEHVALANAGSLSPAQTGFAMSLKARGAWEWVEGADIAQRSEPLTSNHQIDSCARCHARRGTLGEYHPGKPLLDTHRWLSLKSRFTGPMDKSATRYTSTVRLFRARCIRPAWPVPTAITRTATSLWQKATACVPNAISPAPTTTPPTTDTRSHRPEPPAWIATCRASFTWGLIRVAITACASHGLIFL